MKTFSHLILPAASIHVVSAAGYLRGDDGGIDTSFSSRHLDVVGSKTSYSVINFDLFEVSILLGGDYDYASLLFRLASSPTS
jgi:hypothetical protein